MGGGDGKLLYAMVVCSFIFYCVYAFLSAKLCGISFIRQSSIVCLYLIITGGIGLGLWILLYVVGKLDVMISSNLVQIVIFTVSYLFVFVLISYLFRIKSFLYLLEVLKTKLSYGRN